MAILLQVSGLSINIDGRPIVKNVTFSVEEGERVCIVGESGSGKTVTALSLPGLNPGRITTGSAFFDDGRRIDLFSCGNKILHTLRGKEIGYVFQEPSLCLNPVIRCGEQVAEVIRVHKNLSPSEAKVHTLRWFSKTGFDDPERIFQSFPHQLSGGQKQRIMLCIAMAPEPKLLIADEPTTGLDMVTQKQIADLLVSLCRDSKTSLLFITHDLTLAVSVGNWALIMHAGEIVEQGQADSVLKFPKHAYTKKLVAAQIGLEKAPSPAVGEHNETILEVKDISASYQTESIFGNKKSHFSVRNISFSLRKGETLGLVGESGSGKSTVGRLLMGLKQPDEGNIILFGNDLKDLDGEQLRIFRKKFRIIFQDPYSSLNPKIKVGKQISETMAAYGMYGTAARRKQKTEEWLRRVGLEAEDFHKFPHMFSGGQRQRIAIARALACEPDFLVCDECVSSLDASLRHEILNLLVDLRRERNLTMLFISHDLDAVRYMCQNILLLKNGSMTGYGSVDKVLA